MIKKLCTKLHQLFQCLLLGFVLSSCTTIYLVRHAERLDNSYDSPLSDTGFQRAGDLYNALLNKGIDSIFVSTFLRTQQTADPLSHALGKKYVIYGLDSTQLLTQHLKLIKGKNILVVGHSNNIPQMVFIITNQTVNIPDNTFNKMFIITIRQWPSICIHLKEKTYGAPSPPLP